MVNKSRDHENDAIFNKMRVCTFSFDNLLENKTNIAYNFLCYCIKRIDHQPDFLMVCNLIDHRYDTINSPKLGSETTCRRIMVPLEF